MTTIAKCASRQRTQLKITPGHTRAKRSLHRIKEEEEAAEEEGGEKMQENIDK